MTRNPLIVARENAGFSISDLADDSGIEWRILKLYESRSGYRSMTLFDANLISKCLGVQLQDLLPGHVESDSEDSSTMLAVFLTGGQFSLRSSALSAALKWPEARIRAAMDRCDAGLRMLGGTVKEEGGFVTLSALQSRVPAGKLEISGETEGGDLLEGDLMEFASLVMSTSQGVVTDDFSELLAERFIKEGVMKRINGRIFMCSTARITTNRWLPKAELVAKYQDSIFTSWKTIQSQLQDPSPERAW